MGKLSAIQAKNRKRNAGGVMPSATETAVSLAITFKKLTKNNVISQGSHRSLLLFLYLWLTKQLESITCAEDVPDLVRVTTAEECTPHGLRNFKDSATSWCEYAQLYRTRKGDIYLWQPLPTILQALFQPVVASLSYHSPFLTKSEKQHFYALLQQRWKTPLSLRRYRRNRRDTFFRYFFYCIQVDPTLSSLAKMVLTDPAQIHHQSAIAYQAEQSDRLRKKIFLAQNRYLQRLVIAITELGLSRHFSCTILGHTKNLTEPLIAEANYLTINGYITAYHLNNQSRSRQYEAIPSFIIGSQRSLLEHEVVDFFARLHDVVERYDLAENMTLEQHRQYFNWRTYELAFQFIALTALRPTHAASIERRRCFGFEHVCVRDKGRWRPIILCAYLKDQINHYLDLQQALMLHFPHHQQNQAMWHLIDENGDQQLLSAKKLRSVMHSLWPGVVPYRLRHFFAQCALTSPPPNRLATQQIDRLMGHTNFGEHLGSGDQFPLSIEPLKNFLEGLAVRLGLTKVQHG